MPSNDSFPCYAVICAAGAGTRMGCTKALCRIRQETFLHNIFRTLQQTPIRNVIVMTGANADEVIDYHQLHRNGSELSCSYVKSPDWQHEHMLETLCLALKHVPDACAVLHWPVDCIDIDARDLNTLLKFLDSNPTQPACLSWNDVPAHPMLIPQCAVCYLRTHSLHFHSLRDFTDSLGICSIQAVFPALMNCNTPEILHDYLANNT